MRVLTALQEPHQRMEQRRARHRRPHAVLVNTNTFRQARGRPDAHTAPRAITVHHREHLFVLHARPEPIQHSSQAAVLVALPVSTVQIIVLRKCVY